MTPLVSLPPAKKKRGCLFYLFVGMFGTTTLCCCLGSALIAAAGDSSEWGSLNAAVPGEVSLGSARAPADLLPGSERPYHWGELLERYGLDYGISTELHALSSGSLESLATKFRYTEGEGNAFTWVIPPECRPQAWRCIYDSLATDNRAQIEPLTELFRARQAQVALDPRQTAELVVTFVQGITYRLPTEAKFGILPPAIVVADGSGDCDSKSLLAAMMLEELGIDCVLLYSEKLQHAALGVALPGTGRGFNHDGQKYLFVEITNPGWPIGIIPPQHDKVGVWEVVPFALHD